MPELNPKYAFKGVWIPKEIWESKAITWMEKCLLAEVNALDDGTGCFAGNEWLASKFGSSPASIANQISKLRRLEMIEDISFNGRERRIRINAALTVGLRQPKPDGEGRDNPMVIPSIGEPKGENTPQPPKGGEGESSIQSKVSKLPTTEPAIRIATIFHRKLTTEWDDKEITAFKKLPRPLDLEELGLLEEYYSAHWPPTRDDNILRHDLKTFLNNYRGEIDRARTWKENPKRENKKTATQTNSNGASKRNAGTFNAGGSAKFAGVEKLA